MPAIALIKFVQGLSTPPAGEALIGVLTTPVLVSNGDNANVAVWEWTVIDKPPGSAAVGSGLISTASSFSFNPDLRGGYHFQLEVRDINGVSSIDRLVFQVAEPTGFVIPPFDALASALNFSAQLRGWAKYLEELLRFVLPPLDTEVTFESTAKWKDTAMSNPTTAKMATRARRRQLQTTTATANQVLDDGGVFGGEDFTLLNNATTMVVVTGVVKRNGVAEAGTFELKGAFYRHSAGAPVRIGTDVVTTSFATMSATLDLNINGNKIEIRVTPGAANTFDWRLVRVQYEGES